MVVKEKLFYSILVFCSFLLVLISWNIGYSVKQEFIKKNTIKIAKVQSGSFVEKINGYGELQSINQRLITSENHATIDGIILKPGAKVNSDTIILTLKNPEVERKLIAVKSSLKNAEIALKKQDLLQQREILEQKSLLSDLNMELELAELQVEAETTLAESGVVSKMEFKRSLVKAKQLKTRITFLKNKLKKLAEVHIQQLRLLKDAVTQASSEVRAIELQIENLQVKAGLNGVLQRLPISLGESVQPGKTLALVGSLTPLMAQIRISQLKASSLSVGARADIDTRHGVVQGFVTRIDPVIDDGAVLVDIKLPQTSNDVKPMQVVDAVIYGKSENDVLYVKKPIGVFANSKVSLFKLTNNNLAQKVEVSFGNISGDQIEIKSGLKSWRRNFDIEIKVELRNSDFTANQLRDI